MFIHVFGGRSWCSACGVALIRSREEAFARPLAAGWVWFKCQKEKGRKINGLSEVNAFLQLPQPCLSRDDSAN